MSSSILVVTGERSALQPAADRLVGLGLRVAVAADAAQAAERGARAALALIDGDLPGQGAVESVRRLAALAEEERPLPLAWLGPDAQDGPAAAALEAAGAVDWLPKPLEGAQALSRLEGYLALAARRRGQAPEGRARPGTGGPGDDLYRQVFESAPLALMWLDLSPLRQLLDELRAAGVADARAYLERHPEELQRCAARLSVAEANQVARAMGVRPKEELPAAERPRFDAAALAVLREALLALAGGAACFDGEASLLGPDGKPRSAALRLRPAPGCEGSLARVVVSILDVTERRAAQRALRESEERYRSLVELSPEAIVVHSGGRIVYVNPSGVRLFGGTDPSQAIGRDVLGFVHPGSRAVARERMLRGYAQPNPRTEQQVVRLDGQTLDVEISSAPVIFEGEPASQLIVTDITGRRRAEREREALLEAERAARAEAERAARMKDEFLSTLSHELRTPLSTILGWSERLLRREAPPETVRRGLEAIGRAARAQASLVDDLLDTSRIVSGRLKLSVEPVQVAPVIEGAIESVRLAAEAKRLRLERRLEPQTETVAGDAARLQQVVWNLLANAVKFTPEGGRVEVSERRVGDSIEIAVRDDGPGIDPEFLPHIFERFRQADASASREHGGLGLGLAIVRHLVELHGGSVEAHSDGRGRGSTFRVLLPLCLRGAAGQARTELLPDLAGVRVLAVDDDPDARELIALALERAHASVAVVSSAAEALAAVRADPPSVLVSDIGMPGEDGYALIRQVRSLPPGRGGDVPALALTAFARPQDRYLAIGAGYQLHLAKPYEHTELIVAVATLAGRGERKGPCGAAAGGAEQAPRQQ